MGLRPASREAYAGVRPRPLRGRQVQGWGASFLGQVDPFAAPRAIGSFADAQSFAGNPGALRMPCAVGGAVYIYMHTCVYTYVYTSYKRGFSSARCDRRPQLTSNFTLPRRCYTKHTQLQRTPGNLPKLARSPRTLRSALLELAQFAPPRQPTITHPLRPARARARPPPPRFAASAACSTIESAAGRPRPVRGGFSRRCTRGVGFHKMLGSACCKYLRRVAAGSNMQTWSTGTG